MSGPTSNLGLVPYGEAFDLQRSLAGAVSQSDPRDGDLPRAPTGGHLRAKNRDGRAAHSRRCSGRDRRDGPWRKVDLPRAGPARLLSDPRPRKAREGRQALRQEPRGGSRPDFGHIRAPRNHDRRANRRLDAAGRWARAAEDRLDRRSRLPLGDDSRLRAQRRPRSRSLHGVDNRLRPRGRRVHDDGPRARRPIGVEEVRPAAIAAIAEVFELEFDDLPADDGTGLWPQSIHASLAAR